ncbi:MAG: UDP-N-acetylglucosamine 1-carboxyvinyltransferase [bacterium]|jgi:UDP-N-acetylglucosamine 1-carboxyvinyltransferase
MGTLVIEGETRLKGRVTISGAKNAVLAVLPATLLAEGETIIENSPGINDVRVMGQILAALGAEVKENGSGFKINPGRVYSQSPPLELVKKLRASSLLLGPLLARYGQAEIVMPGGCNIGPRPLDQHIKGLRALGAEVKIERGFIWARAKKLKGAPVYLDVTSVGATENIMMVACLAEGKTVIENAAKEPEIVDIANLLNAMGASVKGAGTDVIRIQGVKHLRGARHTIIPDRIEAGTFMIAAAATRGEVTIENVIPEHLEPVIAKLREAGARVEVGEDSIKVTGCQGTCQPLDIKTLPYPGFPTDLQSPMTALLTTAAGTSIIKENIFENRFRHVDEFKRMGAQIKVEGRTAVVEGVDFLSGARVRATDLRAGAALIIAALMARGETIIQGTEHIDRGYENITGKFRALGAHIRRED